METRETAKQIQSRIISQLTPEKKLELSLNLYFNARFCFSNLNDFEMPVN